MFQVVFLGVTTVPLSLMLYKAGEGRKLQAKHNLKTNVLSDLLNPF
jgi:hypothetical protein